MATTDIFRSMIAYWKSFDLQKLQEELDRTASILAVRCEETDISRQLLLQKSRDFKRNSSEDVQKAIAPLLKSFQSEIDGLLRRSKLAESAFLTIYKKIIHMPDMLPILMAAEQLQSEVERLNGCSTGFSPEETKDDESHRSQCKKDDDDDDVCVSNHHNGLNFESNEMHQNDKSDYDNFAYSGRENIPLSEDNSAVGGASADADDLDEDEKNVVLMPNSSARDKIADSMISDEHPDVSIADLQRQTSADPQSCNDLDSNSGHDFDGSDKAETKLGEVAMDDFAAKEAGENKSAISDCCKTLTDHSIDGDTAQVTLKDQTEPDTDVMPDGCESSSEPHASSSNLKAFSDDQAPEVDSVGLNGEVDHPKDQLPDPVGNRHWSALYPQEEEDTKCPNSWPWRLNFPGKLDKEKGLSGINLSNVESLASEVGQEVVSSFQNSHYPAHGLWAPEVENGQAELTSFLPSSDVPGTNAVHYNSNFSVNCGDAMPEDLKTETADDLASLDTMDVSRRIREILSFHNLGQRLFARYVLGLSQGTVSELLSKPKPWEKLTEKGRESYRKMHQWASNECNIQMLKSLSSPKCNVSSSSNCPTDSAAEERIAQILSEAQAAMNFKQEAVEKTQLPPIVLPPTKTSEMHLHTAETSAEAEKTSRKPKSSRKGSGHTPGPRNDASKSRKTHADSENLTREIVARIYQEELEKLAQAAEASGNVVELLSYRQELARLNHGWTKRPSKSDAHKSVTEDKENHKQTVGEMTSISKKLLNENLEGMADSNAETADEPQDLSVSGSGEMCSQSLEGVDLSAVKMSDSPIPLPGISPVSLPSSSSSGGLLSPLQRMQSIANSLMLQSSVSPSAALQPTRAILPPISQEQFDMHGNINTDDLVKRVKDVLSQYSISQRLFGEYVLGLSQGSVSDLLARPKPWHLLTQKGREPFIRMQMFVDEPEAVQKLVASQYRVPTEKLLRSNSSSHLDVASHGMVSDNSGDVAESCNILPVTSQSSKPFRSFPASHGDVVTPPSSSALSASVFTAVSSSSSHSAPSSLPDSFDKSLSNGVGFPPMGVAMVPSVLSLFGATFLPSAQFGPLMNVDVHHLYGGGGQAGATPEVGTSTAGPELDTQAITAQVKEVLQLNNLGQKLFGEAVLELSQGSVSELLSKPKPWHMLSLKGREPFVKMQIWLNDPLGVQKLHAYQTHMAGRRRKSGCDGPSGDKPGSQKKPRLFFSEEQKEALKMAYLRDPYPNQLAIEQLASELDIGVKTVINWFHNHRMRAKQHHNGNSPTSTTAGSPSSSVLARIKSEALDDLMDQTGARSTSLFSQEDNSVSSHSCRSRCDSGTSSGLDGKTNKLTSAAANPKSGSTFSSSGLFSCSKNNSLENKRHELNKRKRARPHRLYNGATDAGELQVAEEYRATLDMAIDLSVNRSSGDVKNDRLISSKEGPKIRGDAFRSDDHSSQILDAVKVESPDDWNDSRVKNIEKLQHNLLLAPSDDWEF